MNESSVLNIGSRLEPFVDHYLIDSLTDARLQLHHPQPADVAVRFDAPWEGFFAGGISVLQDGPDFHMYYRGKPTKVVDGKDEVTCYAHSRDGIHWEKPELGLVNINGSSRNNVLYDDTLLSAHNFCPFIDTRPNVPADERYKGVAGLHPKGIFAVASPDGIHWRRLQEEPLITSEKFAFDSQNVAFWSETEGCYVLYFRTWKPHPDITTRLGYRWISRATSDDFIHWSEPVEMDTGDAPIEDLYTNQTHPYFRAPHIYVALAARFWQGKRVLSEEQAQEINVVEGYHNDCSDGVFMTSRGGHRYDRTFLESFIRPGLGANHWVSRTNYPGRGVIPTGPAKMSLFVHREYAQPTSHAARFTLRTDGFASVNAPYSGGDMITHPIIFSGRELVINFSTSAAGSVRVELQDVAGKPLPGHSLDEAVSITGDEIARSVAWQSGTDLSRFAGQPMRLRFVMRDADLYALQWKE